MNTPAGRSVVVGFAWSSEDVALGRKYLDQFVQVADTAAVTVTTTSVLEWMKALAAFVPDNAYGTVRGISVRAFTADLISAVSEQLDSMPNDPTVGFSVHECRGRATSPQIRAVFPERKPHYLLEILAISKSDERTRAHLEWATEVCRAVKNSDNGSGNVLPSTYIALTPPDEANFPVIYKQNWQRLVDIKKQYDQQNVFKNGYVQF